MEKYYFFWKNRSMFSNWFPSKFKVNGYTYNCGEQYMMHQKAIGFGDLETAHKIMETESPAEQKRLGRTVKNFDNDAWALVRYSVVKRGLREKFQQNPELKAGLLNLKGSIFVEASPMDRIWGIGYTEEDALNNIDNWGLNLLGKILTELSNEIV